MLTQLLLVPKRVFLLPWNGRVHLSHPYSFLPLSYWWAPPQDPVRFYLVGSSHCSTLFAVGGIYPIRQGMVIALILSGGAFFKVSLTSASKASWEGSLCLVPLHLAGNEWLHPNFKFLDAPYASTWLNMTLWVETHLLTMHKAVHQMAASPDPSLGAFGAIFILPNASHPG